MSFIRDLIGRQDLTAADLLKVFAVGLPCAAIALFILSV